MAGRFFAGLGVGLLSATIPLYQSETSPKWIRGAIVGCYQWAITIGLLLAAIVNNATKDRNDTGSYRIPVAVQFAWAIILWSEYILLQGAVVASGVAVPSHPMPSHAIPTHLVSFLDDELLTQLSWHGYPARNAKILYVLRCLKRLRACWSAMVKLVVIRDDMDQVLADFPHSA